MKERKEEPMGQVIKSFADGSFLEYDKGSFDEWCVYLTKPYRERRAPRDVEYFGQLKWLAGKYGVKKVYGDYVRVYEMTGKKVEKATLAGISQIAAAYGEDALEADIIFTILYMAMIAEEQKEFTRLGKRIKRLGIYKLLIERKSIYEAANFMRGMGWREIAALCLERGF
jgi:dissimilatory sulfite reductase (desulfoviridin) alpha/beta subunit